MLGMVQQDLMDIGMISGDYTAHQGTISHSSIETKWYEEEGESRNLGGRDGYETISKLCCWNPVRDSTSRHDFE